MNVDSSDDYDQSDHIRIVTRLCSHSHQHGAEAARALMGTPCVKMPKIDSVNSVLFDFI